MNPEVLVALLSGLGTLLGSVAGIIASSRLTVFRIGQLEKKVDEHNQFGKRIPVIEEKVKVINHRIDDLERMEEIHEKLL